jgi:hypothetical protein
MAQYRTYNVPLALVSNYRNCRLIVRARDPVALADCMAAEPNDEIVLVQLLDISAELDVLETSGYGTPVEVVLNDPQTEAAKLYRVMKLQRTHPVRIVIPVVAGFSKAIKVASSLNLPIKLEGTQPEPAVIEELCEALDHYLQSRAASQPIDYFSGLLMARLHRVPITLWDIQEEDPASVRYITDDGNEVIARRPFVSAGEGLDSFRFTLIERVLSNGEECASCEFFPECGGYFKWPNRNFSCEGIRHVLHKLQGAANELHDDLESFPIASTEPAI